MTKSELLKKLIELKDIDDTESIHIEADRALLDYIADSAITEAFEQIPKWYAWQPYPAQRMKMSMVPNGYTRYDLTTV